MDPTKKKKKVYELTWNYNKNGTPKDLKQRNITNTQKVFDLLSEEQRQTFEEKISDYKEWVEYFLKEDYSS